MEYIAIIKIGSKRFEFDGYSKDTLDDLLSLTCDNNIFAAVFKHFKENLKTTVEHLSSSKYFVNYDYRFVAEWLVKQNIKSNQLRSEFYKEIHALDSDRRLLQFIKKFCTSYKCVYYLLKDGRILVIE